MTNKMKFNKKYKQPLNTANGKDDIVRLTGIPKKILDVVYDRGLAAHKNNPQSVRNIKGKKVGGKSLKGKMSAQQWSMARVYAFVMKGKTWQTADSDLADKVRKLRIKGYIR
tara:strand:- start:555 stop:890 length:336 start_codon:yes stop_codon:yes gene_type:complete